MGLEKITVADSRIAGRGVYAKEDIRKGEPILDFRGPIITLEEALARPVDGCPLQIGAEIYLDLPEPDVLVNHSCMPNAGLRKFTLTALTEIRRGTEIFFDYSTTMDEDNWTLPCACGAETCRGIVTDFKFLPPDLQEEYLDLGVVQDFIVRQYPRVRRVLG
ncbi:MAG: SET domain-containing protein [Patescibacteria group bacterium]